MPRPPKHDTFLADIVRPAKARDQHFTYGDGFRLGMGFLIAHVLVFTVVGGLSWVLCLAFGLNK